MKKTYLRILSIVTFLAIVIGCAYNLGLIGNKGKAESYEEVDVDYDYDGVEEISIDVGLVDMHIVSGDRFNVHYKGQKRLLPNITQDGNAIKIAQGKTVEVGFNFFKSPKGKMSVRPSSDLTITVPEGVTLKNIEFDCGLGGTDISNVSFEEMNIDCALGDIQLNDVKVGTLKVVADLGDVELKNVEAEDIDAELSLGDFKAELIKNVNEYNYDIEVALGECKVDKKSVSNTYKTGGQNMSIKVDCSMGNVDIANG